MTEALARPRGSTSIPGTGSSLCGGPETGSGSAARARGRPASAPPLPGPPPCDASSLEQLSDHGESGVSSACSRPGEVSVEPRGEESREVRAHWFALGTAGLQVGIARWGRGAQPGQIPGPLLCVPAQSARSRVGKRGRPYPPRARAAGTESAAGKGGAFSPERLCLLLPAGGRQTPETPGPAAAQVRQVGWGVRSSGWG